MWACVLYLIVCFSIIEVPGGNFFPAYQKRTRSNSVKGQGNVPKFKKRLPARTLSSRDQKKSLRENKDCWLTLNAKEHFTRMDALEKQFEADRREFDEEQYFDKFDEEILGTLLADHGATNRETQRHANLKRLIPSGLNLGGYSMMRMKDSIMFFHRMKLRNDTVFRVNYLGSNFTNMVLTGRLALNDLHLIGTYERVQTTPTAPSKLFYTPAYGEVEFLLRNVLYKMEGRYRLQKDRLFLEVIISELYIPRDGILMTYKNANSTTEAKIIQTKHISDFLDRMKTDLDLWLKDFFNEFLLNNPPKSVPSQDAFQKYDKERVITLNRYVDEVLGHLTKRMEELHDDIVRLPSFSIYSFNGLELEMRDGTLMGLDTMYRRSMATNNKVNDVRDVDALISFSSLKVRYTYEVKMTSGAPPLYGSLILTADELTALMCIHLVKDPPFVDLKFDFLRQLKPESLTVEGSVAGVVANFKHLLELHVISIMTNTMVNQVKALKSLVECVPSLLPKIENKEEESTGSGKDNKKDRKKQIANMEIRPDTTPRRRKPTKRTTEPQSDEANDNDLKTTTSDAMVDDEEAVASDEEAVASDAEVGDAEDDEADIGEADVDNVEVDEADIGEADVDNVEDDAADATKDAGNED